MQINPMKNLLFVVVITICCSSKVSAQLCKHAKVGMSSAELIHTVGKPDSISFSGTNEKDSLFTWHYGGQDAVISQGYIQKLIMDPKKEGQLNQQVINGNLSPEDFEKQLEELNDNSCK
jgi:hypothetical protein